MEWIVGIYLVIGFVKTIAKFANPNPGIKPIWMSTETDGLKLAAMFTVHTLLWPFTR